jgi:hypothetical protein
MTRATTKHHITRIALLAAAVTSIAATVGCGHWV